MELHSRLLNSVGQLQNLTVRDVGKLIIQVVVFVIFSAIIAIVVFSVIIIVVVFSVIITIVMFSVIIIIVVILGVITLIFAVIIAIVLQGNLYESRGRARDVGANISNVDITNIEHLEVIHILKQNNRTHVYIHIVPIKFKHHQFLM